MMMMMMIRRSKGRMRNRDATMLYNRTLPR